MAKRQTYYIIINEIEPYSPYNINFGANSAVKCMNSLSPTSMISFCDCSSKRMALAENNPRSLICH